MQILGFITLIFDLETIGVSWLTLIANIWEKAKFNNGGKFEFRS